MHMAHAHGRHVTHTAGRVSHIAVVCTQFACLKETSKFSAHGRRVQHTAAVGRVLHTADRVACLFHFSPAKDLTAFPIHTPQNPL